jgi:hypothetical protein
MTKYVAKSLEDIALFFEDMANHAKKDSANNNLSKKEAAALKQEWSTWLRAADFVRHTELLHPQHGIVPLSKD